MLKYLFSIIMPILLIGFATFFGNISNADETVADIYTKIESLKISWHGYTLGSNLNESQKKIAKQNPLPSETSGTYKFKDGSINIVADKKTDRVIIIFETFEAASEQKLKDMVGELIIVFKEPTLSAHDKIIYWLYGDSGKYTTTQFETAKEALKNGQQSLSLVATVKLQSEIPITQKGENKGLGKFYYVISSEILLKNLKTQ
ncbi:MAG: hypothetical protein HQK68_00695 [Desulfamplus sp.]|nr:hypothetical protein [Desulfamplus sp.]